MVAIMDKRELREVTMHDYIITTALIAAAMAIITKILFLGKSLSERKWKRSGWAILDNGEYVVFEDEED